MTIAAGKTPFHRYFPGSAMAPEAIPFEFGNAADLRVEDSTGAARVEGLHYSLTGDAPTGASSITALVSVQPDVEWLLWSETPRQQDINLVESKRVPLPQYSRELDRRAMIERELTRDLGRAPLVPMGESAPAFASLAALADGDLLEYRGGQFQRLDPAPFAGKFFAGGADGRLIPASGTGGGDAALRGDLVDPLSGPAMIAFRRGSGVVQTIGRKLLQRVAVLDYCTDAQRDDILSNTGSIDVSEAWQDALDDLAPNGVLYTGGGTHRLLASVGTTAKPRIRIIGEGARIIEDSPETEALMDFTSCHRMLVEDMHFVGSEDQTYWAANSPTERRFFLRISNSERVRVADVTGEAKRGHIQLSDCNNSVVEKSDFLGFFPADVSLISNSNYCTSVNFAGGRHNKILYCHAEQLGSLASWGFDGTGHTAIGCTGRYLHDNGIYGSSGTRCRALANDFSDVQGSGVKLRGSLNIAFGNSGEDVGTLVALTGNGVTPDDFGANGHGNIAALNSGRGVVNNGISFSIQDGLYARDTVIALNAISDVAGVSGNGGISGLLTQGAVILGNVVSEVSGDYGILLAGQSGVHFKSASILGNVVTDFTGAQQPIRANYMRSAAFVGNVGDGGASLVQVRQTDGATFIGNTNPDGQAVSASTGNGNENLVVIGQRGSSTVPADSVASMGNFPAAQPTISSAPPAIGLTVISSGIAYISVGTSSPADWKAVVFA